MTLFPAPEVFSSNNPAPRKKKKIFACFAWPQRNSAYKAHHFMLWGKKPTMAAIHVNFSHSKPIGFNWLISVGIV